MIMVSFHLGVEVPLSPLLSILCSFRRHSSKLWRMKTAVRSILPFLTNLLRPFHSIITMTGTPLNDPGLLDRI
jgi:hypothetical protein